MRYSSRSGPRWHGKGWRDGMGRMCVNVKRTFYTMPFSREREVGPNELLHSLLRDIEQDISRNEQPLPDGCYLDFQRFRKSLWAEPEDALVGEYFDGGETINCKVYDQERKEVINDGREWMYK